MWILLLIIFILPLTSHAASAGDVVINEIMYNPEGADSGGKVSLGTYYSHEWVELFNISSQAVDLTDWRFNDGSNHILNIPPEKGSVGSIIVQPGDYTVLADDAATFLLDHPGFTGTVIDTVMSLKNTSDTLSLKDADGNIIDSTSYQNSMGADGNGKTLEKTGESWSESSAVGGTPGAQNSTNEPPAPPPPPPSSDPDPIEEPPPTSPSVYPKPTEGPPPEPTETNSETNSTTTEQVGEYPGKTTFVESIFINEVMPNPTGPDSEEEWVEIFNANNEVADISGWQIRDTSGATSTYVFADGMRVPANSFLVLSRVTTGLTLNNDTDGLELTWPTGEIKDAVQYENAKKGYSYSKIEDGWEWSSVPTPGSANIIPKIPQDTAPTNKIKEEQKTPEKIGGKDEVVEGKQTNKNDEQPQGINHNLASLNLKNIETADAENNDLLPYTLAALIALLSALFVFLLKKRLRN